MFFDDMVNRRDNIMAFPKLLFHVPQQNSSNDTMTGSFQISNTVNPLLTPPPGGLFISITFEGTRIKNKSELPTRELVQMKFYGRD